MSAGYLTSKITENFYGAIYDFKEKGIRVGVGMDHNLETSPIILQATAGYCFGCKLEESGAPTRDATQTDFSLGVKYPLGTGGLAAEAGYGYRKSKFEETVLNSSFTQTVSGYYVGLNEKF